MPKTASSPYPSASTTLMTKTRERILKFLHKTDAEFTNLRLEEKSELWSERLKIDLPPAVFVFDREGRIAGKFELEKANYEKYVEPLVDQLLKK